jgi:hypothetical protein
MFPGRGHTIVATGTATGHIAMNETDIQPVGGRKMAVITLCAARHMPRILTSGGYSIVTVRTVARRIGVIELHRQPVGLGSMAGITF